jgi:hypothetical protein
MTDRAELELRASVFYSICVPLRIALVLLLFYYPSPDFVIPLFAFALGFAYKYGKETKKGFFGGEVYWPRLLHSMLYFLCASMLLFESTRDYAYIALAVDVVVGSISNTLYNLKQK